MRTGRTKEGVEDRARIPCVVPLDSHARPSRKRVWNRCGRSRRRSSDSWRWRLRLKGDGGEIGGRVLIKRRSGMEWLIRSVGMEMRGLEGER